ncbi:S41 family peptidase [Streptomyces somaliensis DSM 40738]|uniref:PDZ domain-containing protein n=1 Tax=Streptomyces somaliensis (strain ATCC 33201 / DSM 40738 / JCM 12659 / KCTC 9044 / NCTC 11332 / NRRL B-12077 / IP 733) TaxID=1134445 RepID=A0AA44DE43_STRE0|nr:S41 family peptidase [Streptomyces somaliensis]MCQ0022931.1 S41 family peptidase [Streptomyces somaliensis DSM 40738]NKY15193.1 PDZ domain-containing protein [Streptomyces somaliensis DSM 40738]
MSLPGPESSLRPRRIGRGAALTVLFATVLATAAVTDCLPRDATPPRAARSGPPAAPLSRAGAVRDQVFRAAVEAAADGKPVAQAAEEVVSRSGDRWGVVYDRGEYEDFRRALDGAYTGVGLWARRTADGHVEVARVQRGGPAERAGLRPGDRLRTVDGRSVRGCAAAEVVALLRGDGADGGGGARAEAGSAVVLGVQRGARAWTLTLRRARLAVEAVTVRRVGDAVLIRISAFTRGSGDQVRRAVDRAPDGAGVLLDLRGNGGGLVTEAVVAASAFLDGGLVATYDVHGEERALYAEPGGDTERPLVALIDGGTTSAAELLTGALKDRGRAVTVGARTFGKGSVQMPSSLPGGSVAELTVGHYRTPAGARVDGRGIVPDVPAPIRAEERARTVLSGLGTGA